jgi:DNA helicase-2/ATP-dependent DNA helicase PcrA
LQATFDASRFAAPKPLYSERPFLLWLEGVTVGGRVDAIFGESDGAWEIVDYKTGSAPDPADPVPGLQLDLYALGAMEIWGKKPVPGTLHRRHGKTRPQTQRSDTVVTSGSILAAAR